MAKKNLGKSTVDLEKGKIQNPPDIEAQYRAGYQGRTKTLYDEKRGVTEIRDVIKNDYDQETKDHSQSSNAGGNPLKIQKSFKRGAVKELDGE